MKWGTEPTPDWRIHKKALCRRCAIRATCEGVSDLWNSHSDYVIECDTFQPLEKEQKT